MYKNHFAFSKLPFSIAPDPGYLYMSGSHKQALAHLLHGIKGDGGFVLLTGDVGTGKTTICRCLLENLPDQYDIAFICNPKLTVQEMLLTICEEFGLEYYDTTVNDRLFITHIHAYLLNANDAGRKAILIIDEAQHLAADVLEQLRRLTKLKNDNRKLLQIILLGQPELHDVLAQRKLRRLARRIVARYHLKALDKSEVAAYINHRLKVAGSMRPLFPAAILRRIYRLSAGVPRVINLLCDRALLGAYVHGKDQVDRKILIKAARETLGERIAESNLSLRYLAWPRFAFLRGIWWARSSGAQFGYSK